MRVLVSAASRHGATTEVAASVAAALGKAGLDTVVLAPSEVTSVEGYGAAVIGSGVYAGHWLEPAKELLQRNHDGLGRIPVWLFSSGPVGDPPKPAEDPVDAAPMVELVGARGHRVFAGLLERKRLGLAEKAILAVVRAPEGDYRPWDDIDAWAAEIASALRPAAATPA
jgi:menaquinone-dependent protoporphyrinogen oxidase